MTSPDVSTLNPVPLDVTLEDGTVVLLEPLKMRQFFRLMRIITHGGGPAILNTQLSPGDDIGEFITKLVTLLLFSIPDAEQETIDFFLSVVKPIGLIERRPLNKADRERNTALYNTLVEKLDNPELEDFVTVIEAVVQREAADIQSLGKRLMSMLKVAQKVGVTDPELSSPNPTFPVPTSSEDSAEPSTLSPPNTDGQTNISPTSPSVESVNVPLLSVSGNG
jgi:hypothetical protein